MVEKVGKDSGVILFLTASNWSAILVVISSFEAIFDKRHRAKIHLIQYLAHFCHK